MKFGEEIERAIFSEWRAYYFDYGYLKKVLEETWEQFPYKELFEHHEIFIENDPDPRYAFQFLIAAATFKRFNVHIAETTTRMPTSSGSVANLTNMLTPSSPTLAKPAGGGRLVNSFDSIAAAASAAAQPSKTSSQPNQMGNLNGSFRGYRPDGTANDDADDSGVDVDGVRHTLLKSKKKNDNDGDDDDEGSQNSVEMQGSASSNDYTSTKVDLVDFAEQSMVDNLSRRHGGDGGNVVALADATNGASSFTNRSFILTGSILLTPPTKEHVHLVRAITKMALAGADKLSHQNNNHPTSTADHTTKIGGVHSSSPAPLTVTTSAPSGSALPNFESATFDMDLHAEAAIDMMKQLLIVVDALAVSDIRRNIRILPSGAIATIGADKKKKDKKKKKKAPAADDKKSVKSASSAEDEKKEREEAEELAKGRHIVAFEGEEEAAVLRKDGIVSTINPTDDQPAYKTMTVTGRYIIHSFLDQKITELNHINHHPPQSSSTSPTTTTAKKLSPSVAPAAGSPSFTDSSPANETPLNNNNNNAPTSVDHTDDDHQPQPSPTEATYIVIPKANDEAQDLLITTAAQCGTMDERRLELAEKARVLTMTSTNNPAAATSTAALSSSTGSAATGPNAVPTNLDGTAASTDATSALLGNSSSSPRRADGSTKGQKYDLCVSYKSEMILRIAALLAKISAAPHHQTIHHLSSGAATTSDSAGDDEEEMTMANHDVRHHTHITPHHGGTHHDNVAAHNVTIDSCKTAAIDLRPKLTYSAVEFAGKHQDTGKKATGGKRVKIGHVVDTIANMDFFLPDKKFQLYSGNPSIPFAIYVYQQFVSTSFREAVRSEIDKVSSFYITESRLLATSALVCVDVAKMWKQLTNKERTQLNIAFRQIYLTLDVLQQFCDINYIAILKILKKIDKVTHQDSLDSYKHSIDGVIFKMGRNSRISALQKKILDEYAEHAADGSVKDAHSVLNTGKGAVGGVIAKSISWTLPLLWGITVTLFVAVVLELVQSGYPVLSSPPVTNSTNSTFEASDLLFPFVAHPFSSSDASESIPRQFGTYLALLPATIIMLPFMFSINAMVWERYGINYAFMFDVDPIFHFTGAELMRDSLSYIVVWLICIYAFLKQVNSAVSCSIPYDRLFDAPANASLDHVYFDPLDDDIPSYVALYAVLPIWVAMYATRAIYNNYLDNSRQPWMLFTIGRILTAPLQVVKFSDFFVCDQLTSITEFLFEVQFYWCTFSPSHVLSDVCIPGRSWNFLALSIIPNLGRFVQCIRRFYDEDPRKRKPFPNLVNMGKYLSAIVEMVAKFAAGIVGFYYPDEADKPLRDTMYWIVIALQIFSMLYRYIWDIVVDAGIWIDQHDGRGYQLREDLVYGRFEYYAGFIVADFLLRAMFAWQLIINAVSRSEGPGSAAYTFIHYEWTFLLFAFFSSFRRFLWNFFRVENEHVNNTENYRATKLAPIPQRVLDWDSTTDNMAEKFAKMKGVQSEEFPSIRGYNLTTLTRFFANLPEKEKVAILNSSPEMINRHASWHILQRRRMMYGGGGAASRDIHVSQNYNPHNVGRSQSGLKRNPLPATGAAAGGANSALPKKVDEPLFTGVKHEGKSRFFSELPEEVKALLLLGYLKGETMGGFKTRVTAEEVERKREDLGAMGTMSVTNATSSIGGQSTSEFGDTNSYVDSERHDHHQPTYDAADNTSRRSTTTHVDDTTTNNDDSLNHSIHIEEDEDDGEDKKVETVATTKDAASPTTTTTTTVGSEGASPLLREHTTEAVRQDASNTTNSKNVPTE